MLFPGGLAHRRLALICCTLRFQPATSLRHSVYHIGLTHSKSALPAQVGLDHLAQFLAVGNVFSRTCLKNAVRPRGRLNNPTLTLPCITRSPGLRPGVACKSHYELLLYNLSPSFFGHSFLSPFVLYTFNLLLAQLPTSFLTTALSFLPAAEPVSDPFNLRFYCLLPISLCHYA